MANIQQLLAKGKPAVTPTPATGGGTAPNPLAALLSKGTPATTNTPQTPTTNRFLPQPTPQGGVMSNIATGVAKAEGSAVQGLASIGQKIQEGLGDAVGAIPGVTVSDQAKGKEGFGNTSSPAGQSFSAAMAPQGAAQDVGDAIGTVAPYLTGVGEEEGAALGAKTLAKTGSKFVSAMASKIPTLAANTAIGTVQSGGDVKKGAISGVLAEGGNAIIDNFLPIVSKVASFGKRAILNSDEAKTLAQIADPEAKKFISGKTFQDVVDGTSNAINRFIAKSKADLEAVKGSLPTDIKVPAQRIKETLDNAIMSSVRGAAAYKGVGTDIVDGIKSNVAFKDASKMFNSPEDLINSGILNGDETKITSGMMRVIKDWNDTSARGLLNLKEQLSSFYKPGLDGSNRILSNIQKGLKDIVSDAAPTSEIKTALKTASENIDKADQFTRNLLGSTEQSGESKLLGIASKLKNPALKGYANSLLEDLKNATGHDVLPELQGYANYAELLAKKFPSKIGTIAKGVATSPLAKVVGGVGGVGLVGEGLKDAAGFVGL